MGGGYQGSWEDPRRSWKGFRGSWIGRFNLVNGERAETAMVGLEGSPGRVEHGQVNYLFLLVFECELESGESKSLSLPASGDAPDFPPTLLFRQPKFFIALHVRVGIAVLV